MEDSKRSSQTESLLIEQILEGRRDLFYDVVRPHLAILLRLAKLRMSNGPGCEDIIQQTVLKAFTRLWPFRLEGSFSTWLIRIAINEIHQWRRGRRLSGFFVDDALLSELPLVDRASSPFTEFERTEIRNLIREAIYKLDEKYQQVIRLRDLADLSLSETANLLRLSVSAVKSREHPARRQMQRLLSPQLHPLHD